MHGARGFCILEYDFAHWTNLGRPRDGHVFISEQWFACLQIAAQVHDTKCRIGSWINHPDASECNPLSNGNAAFEWPEGARILEPTSAGGAGISVPFCITAAGLCVLPHFCSIGILAFMTFEEACSAWSELKFHKDASKAWKAAIDDISAAGLSPVPGSRSYSAAEWWKRSELGPADGMVASCGFDQLPCPAEKRVTDMMSHAADPDFDPDDWRGCFEDLKSLSLHSEYVRPVSDVASYAATRSDLEAGPEIVYALHSKERGSWATAVRKGGSLTQAL